MNITLLVSWNTQQDKNGDYYIPYTHYAYVEGVVGMYEMVNVISPVVQVEIVTSGFTKVDIANVVFIALPPFRSLLSAQSKVFSFIRAIRQSKSNTDLYYCRVPDPFCWMPSLLTSKPVIMHFVGDTVDATKNNEKWSKKKKWIMITLYKFEFFLILLAAKRSKVYTNGFHIKSKLEKRNVEATAVISSTISNRDFATGIDELPKKKLTFTYVGFLRNAKGIKTILKLIEILEKRNLDYKFNIVGEGDMYVDFVEIIERLKIAEKITLHGHVDNRDRLNSILRSSDLFIFPSLSEGSPRVIIEAMSQGVPIVSTPVGSLPYVFKDQEDIFFFDFNDEIQLVDIIDRYINDPNPFISARNIAYKRVKENYTKEAFLTEIFKY